MTIHDECYEVVAKLLPCCEEFGLVRAHSPLCPGDKHREAVAAKLRERDEKHAAQIGDVVRRMGDDIADLRTQLELTDVALVRDFHAKLAELNKKFSCGHRAVDWDDSYGNCIVCGFKQMAHDYDKLPHDVVDCHDQIEELQAQLAERDKSIDNLHKVCDEYENRLRSNWTV